MQQNVFFPLDDARDFLNIGRKIFEEISSKYGSDDSEPFVHTGDYFIRVSRRCVVLNGKYSWGGFFHLYETGHPLVGNYSSQISLVLDSECDSDIHQIPDVFSPMFSMRTERNQNDGHNGTDSDLAKLSASLRLKSTPQIYDMQRWWHIIREMTDRFIELTQSHAYQIKVTEIAA